VWAAFVADQLFWRCAHSRVYPHYEAPRRWDLPVTRRAMQPISRCGASKNEAPVGIEWGDAGSQDATDVRPVATKSVSHKGQDYLPRTLCLAVLPILR
jgi:hypothetical protein